ncbi:MAG: right-handed parallel beta-helix repeat-containing protein [Bacteroidales bacterium]
MFRRGDVWRETLRISSSGDSGKQITYSAFGKGPNPKILGSTSASGWVATSVKNVWQSENVTTNPWEIHAYRTEIFFEKKDGSVAWGRHRDFSPDFSPLTDEFDWCWNSGKLYVYSPSNPDQNYKSVEAPQRKYAVMLQDKQYITIDHLDNSYHVLAGIADNYQTYLLKSLRVTYCHISHIGVKNSSMAYGLDVHHSDSYYAFNDIENCGRRGISLTIYKTNVITLSNVIIEYNRFHHGWHTTGVDCNNAGNHLITDIIIRNNLFDNVPDRIVDRHNSNDIFIANQSPGDGVVKNIYIYNNIFRNTQGSAVKFEAVTDVHVLNNTFYGVDPTLSSFQGLVVATNGKNFNIRNNIFYNNCDHSFNKDFYNLYYNDSWPPFEYPAGWSVDNNLYYTTDKATDFMFFWIPSKPAYEARYKMIHWELYKQAEKQDLHSPAPADPMFIDAVNGNYALQKGSPAIGKGVKIDLVTKDFYGNPMNNPPDLGAIQYGSVPGKFFDEKVRFGK